MEALTDSALIWQTRALHPYLSDEWERSVRREFLAGKARAEKMRAALVRLVKEREGG